MTDPLDLIPLLYETIDRCSHNHTRTDGLDLICDDCDEIILNIESERQHADLNFQESKLHPFGCEDY